METYSKDYLRKLAKTENEKQIRNEIDRQVSIVVNMVLDQAKKGNSMYRCPILPSDLLPIHEYITRISEQVQTIFTDSVVSIDRGRTNYIVIDWG